MTHEQAIIIGVVLGCVCVVPVVLWLRAEHRRINAQYHWQKRRIDQRYRLRMDALAVYRSRWELYLAGKATYAEVDDAYREYVKAEQESVNN